MNPLKLYAELQLNPLSKSAYRKLAEHYAAHGMGNEADAFKELIKRKFDADSPDAHEEQRPDDPGELRVAGGS